MNAPQSPHNRPIIDPFTAEGWDAYKNGVDKSECPYDEGTDGQAGWLKGWALSQEHAKRMETKGHWWSGWPGAYCLKCGAEHALENAIGMGWFDPIDERWDTEEHRLEVEKADGTCPADVVKA